MENFQTFVNILLALAAGVVTIDKALDVLRKVHVRATEGQHELTHRVDEHDKKLDNDHRRLTELEGASRLTLRGMMQLMSHEIDGNHTEQLQETRDDIEQYLINR